MKYLIIGGVAGGATTAARLRRMDEQADIILFERGQYISYANCGMPYYIGGTIAERDELLLQTPVSFGNRFNIDVRINEEVTAIHPQKHTVSTTNLKSGKNYEESYDKLILAPGAKPVIPNMEGVGLRGVFTLRSIDDVDMIKTFITQQLGKQLQPQAVVIGGGFVGVEMAENLAHIGCRVTIVEKTEQILTSVDFPLAAPVMKHLKANGVQLILNENVTKIEEASAGLVLHLASGMQLPAQLILISVGVHPDITLAQACGLKLGDAGAIWVNEYLQTSDPDIYAVGDAIEFPHPVLHKSYCCYLAGPANKQARFCADNIVHGNLQRYHGAIGTAIAKIFDMSAGTTGLSSAQLKRENVPFLTSITHSASHAGYYPAAQPLSVKLNFSPTGGRLYGGQVVGYEGVDKRMDVLASIIAKGGTVYDLIDLDHAYAPPYSSAKDPVTVAGYVADNMLQKRVRMIPWDELHKLLQDPEKKRNILLIDVRTVMEYRSGTIADAVNYPVDEIREFLDDIPSDKTIIVFCAVGLRGYVASRILMQSGFKSVYNLSGGITTYKISTNYN
ncbi:MAG: FAD-dependent oxidoreductase [Bacteroidales bacterium]|jgi:NADPH-dependent 2,4-dienoyl-CoA reductase/sulfur reductase-like enzyme/rhodanese-related sulfurtransferase|nr:FAD-dependent oxidoreductase [Bacteroidales bacterium]